MENNCQAFSIVKAPMIKCAAITEKGIIDVLNLSLKIYKNERKLIIIYTIDVVLSSFNKYIIRLLKLNKNVTT